MADVHIRHLQQPLAEALGQPLVIDNRSGANGNLAAEAMIAGGSDGHTFLLSSVKARYAEARAQAMPTTAAAFKAMVETETQIFSSIVKARAYSTLSIPSNVSPKPTVVTVMTVM